MEENQPGDQTSIPLAVQSNPEQMGGTTDPPQESDRSTHRQTDIRHAALPSQLPTTTCVTSHQWQGLLKRDLIPTDFDAVLLGVLRSPTEMEEIKGLNEKDFQSVINVLGEVGAIFDSASTSPSTNTPPSST